MQVHGHSDFRNTFWIPILLLIPFLGSSLSAKGQAERVTPSTYYGASHALLIGINNYPKLPSAVQLQFAAQDVADLRELLIKSYGFPRKNVRTLVDGTATRSNIEKELSSLADSKRVGPQDRILIYFSGHGQTVKLPTGSYMGFLIPSDADLDIADTRNAGPFLATCLRMDTIWGYLESSPAKHTLVLADACYSGLLTRSRGAARRLSPKELANVRAMQVITGGGEGQKTIENSTWGHGAFTFKLLEELRSRATTVGNVFAATDLHSALARSVAALTNNAQTPLLGNYKTDDGDFLFVSTGGPVTAPGKVQVVIDTLPRGARIFIDGVQQVGIVTPAEIELQLGGAKSKRFEIAAELKGFKSLVRSVTLFEGKTADLPRLTFSRKPGETPDRSTLASLHESFLRVDGTAVRMDAGKGAAVNFRGVNLDLWLIRQREGAPLDSGIARDDGSARDLLTRRFGADQCSRAISAFEETWFNEADIDRIAALGLNVIRLPFWYGNLQEEGGAWRPDAFKRLDWLVDKAWARKIYTILDMHGAPGGQGGAAYEGRIRNPAELWTSEANLRRTVEIWKGVADHFRDHPGIAGYDLINAGFSAPDDQSVRSLYNRIYQAIRAVDPDHIIILQAAWLGTADGRRQGGLNELGDPAAFGWSNVVYETNYWCGSSHDVQIRQVDDLVKDFKNHSNWNVPCLVGEVQCFKDEATWTYALERFSSAGLGWSIWNYKKASLAPQDGFWSNLSALFMPRMPQPAVPDLQAESIDAILSKWSQWDTNTKFTLNPMFEHVLARARMAH